MLRRIPTTPLVCLAVFLTAILAGNSRAANPDEALDVLLKPNEAGATPQPTALKAKGKRVHRVPSAHVPAVVAQPFAPPYWQGPAGPITKVKPAPQFRPCSYRPPCILPKPMPRQWEMSTQVLFARTKGTVGWPRYSPYYSYAYWGSENTVDLNDDLGLPSNQTWVQFTAKYQFRPTWAIRYSVLGNQLSGGGWAQRQFQWGPGPYYLIAWNQQLSSKWEHQYHRLGLVYDPIKTCSAMVSIFADWVHTDDKINLSCTVCGYWQAPPYSRSTNPMSVGIQFQRCITTAPNGGALSFDHKAAAMFLDDVEGWDLEAAMRYSIPLGCGRWGFGKGGYRYVKIRQAQTDILFDNTLDGGFVEMGFIF